MIISALTYLEQTYVGVNPHPGLKDATLAFMETKEYCLYSEVLIMLRPKKVVV